MKTFKENIKKVEWVDERDNPTTGLGQRKVLASLVGLACILTSCTLKNL